MPENKKDLSEEDIKNRYITPALNAVGWAAEDMRMEKYFTDGRVIFQGGKHARKQGKKADYLLYSAPNYPIAIVEAKDNNHPVGGGLQQAMDYAEILDIPFAYSSNGDGFVEHDFLTGMEVEIPLDKFPTKEQLLARIRASKKFTPEQETVINQPYYWDADTHAPRYYQRIAINRTIEAVAKGQQRILLVMATGTGKTYTAFQIIERLHRSGCKKKILYLADRNVLIDQTMVQDFKPFKKIMTKIKGKELDSSFEIYMALYQQLVSYDEGVPDPFTEFKPEFFDLILVDECHRGSAKEDSEWRKILEYFRGAAQIGMTATPKVKNGANNLEYFGEPIFTYSLKQGIEDGFLAPYRVTNSFLNVDLKGWAPEGPQEIDLFGNVIPEQLYQRPDFGRELVIKTRREVVARRITQMLYKIGRMTKTIVFCTDVEEADAMRQLLVTLNADMVKEDSRYVMRITGDDAVGKKQLGNFIEPDEAYPVVVTTSEMLSTGVDCKTCGLIVIDKEIGSMTEFKQIVGRGTRLKTDKGKVLKFNESSYESLQEFYDWLKGNTELDSGIHVRYHDNEDGTESLEMTFDDRFDWGDDVDDGVIPKEQSENYQEWLQMFKSKAKENGWEFKKDYDDTYDEYVLILISVGSQEDYYESKRFGNKFVGESDEGRWSEYGEFLGQLPMECIVDCSHSGKCDSDVEYWTDQLAFADGLPLDKAIEFIAEYGAWDREELSQKSPEEIAQIVLWIFCGNLKDEAYQFVIRSGYKTEIMYARERKPRLY